MALISLNHSSTWITHQPQSLIYLNTQHYKNSEHSYTVLVRFWPTGIIRTQFYSNHLRTIILIRHLLCYLLFKIKINYTNVDNEKERRNEYKITLFVIYCVRILYNKRFFSLITFTRNRKKPNIRTERVEDLCIMTKMDIIMNTCQIHLR